MNPEIYTILQEIMKQDVKLGVRTSDRDAHLSVLIARLLVLLAEEAEKSAIKTEKATKWIVRLTWVIATLTFFLVLTSFLDLPKVSIIFDKNRTFKIETHTEKKDNKNIQALPKRSHHVPNIINK